MSAEVKPLNLYQRILAVMNDVCYVQKQGKHQQGYKYAKHDDVVAAIRPALIKHGIVVMYTTKQHIRETSDGGTDKSGNPKLNIFTEVCGVLSLINADAPDERHEIEVYGYGIDNSDKSIGKAISYACKYGMLKGFCLETGDDPESDDIPYQEPTPPKQDLSIQDSHKATIVKLFKSISMPLDEYLDALRFRHKTDKLASLSHDVTATELRTVEFQIKHYNTMAARVMGDTSDVDKYLVEVATAEYSGKPFRASASVWQKWEEAYNNIPA